MEEEAAQPEAGARPGEAVVRLDNDVEAQNVRNQRRESLSSSRCMERADESGNDGRECGELQQDETRNACDGLLCVAEDVQSAT